MLLLNSELIVLRSRVKRLFLFSCRGSLCVCLFHGCKMAAILQVAMLYFRVFLPKTLRNESASEQNQKKAPNRMKSIRTLRGKLCHLC